MTPSRTLREALAHLDEAELVALTRDLVRIPSVVRPGDPGATEAPVAEFVARWLDKEGLAVEVQAVAPGRPNVLAWLGEGERTLLLEGHTDVVTEGDPAAWRYPPFAATLAEGRIWGRGAADMKGGLAAAMTAAAALKRSGARLGGRLVVGLGAESVHEVSLTLHPLYGFPYVPASTIKGAVRNAVIRDMFGGREDRAWDDTFFCLVFGHRGQQGKVRFFDAYPLDPPTVVMDLVNPHYVPYYQGVGNMPPGDYYNPVPVFFGAVEKTHLVLYLGMDGEIGKEMGNEPLEKAVEWLGRAFSIYGLGAKTALGYGLMFLNDGNS
ncbi:MAG: type III-B CRISPR module RAMP protein Cmr6 [Firmicutes bacterium]|nr:type III-B CRISPR module RAMP protein Cmr6 [Bacillota bacterium]